MTSLAIVNARVWTADPRRPWADAVAVRGDRIESVGSSAALRKRGAERVIDAGGAMLVPGFVDAHVHFLAGGARLASVQLRHATTPGELARRVGEFARGLPPGEWITGGDWDHHAWGGALPERGWIDAHTPAHPVLVSRHDGHMALANGRALALAGIDRHTADPPGGTIERGADGEPTGLLRDRAMELVLAVIPPAGETADDRALDAAMRYVAERGVTSVHHMGTWADLGVFRRARAAERLTTRLYAAVPIETWERLRDLVAREGRGDEWLRVGALKAFVDGSLGSRTAAMLEPFDDAPGDRGLLVTDPDALDAWCDGADAAGLHLIVHAIGDRAIRLHLDRLARLRQRHGARDRRARIEHAQHVAPHDLPRFAALDVVASMQPYHAIDDGRWAERVIGARRARTSFPIRSLLDAGARIAFGSDWFVAPPDPLAAIDAAVTRRTLDGAHPGGWIPEERITVDEALRAHTTGAAYASFEDDIKGMIAPGLLADLALIDRDLTRVAPEQIREASVALTVVGGRVIHDRAS